MTLKRVFLLIIVISFLFGLNWGDVEFEYQRAGVKLSTDKYQMSNEHKELSISKIESNYAQKTYFDLPHPSIAQSDYLPSNLIVAYDNSHSPTVGQTAINLEGNLTAAGSVFTVIEGTFSIPVDTNILIIPCSNATYTIDELNEIHDWFTNDGARLLWVAGDSDYGGYFNNTPSNDILTIVGSNLRISADSVYDEVYNDGASYRVAVQTPISDSDINSIITADVESAIFHGPTSVLGYQSGAVVDLNQTSIAGIEIIMKSSINATPLDTDLTGTELDYYSSKNLNGSYPMMAIQNLGNRKSVIASGEAIFSDYQHMYDLYTRHGVWNGGFADGKTLVDNVLAWFGRQFDTPISILGDDEFKGFPGNGSLTNPYRIEGYNITASSGTLISISDTAVYFTVKNVSLNGMSSAEVGISIQNVVNGTITNNSVTNCDDTGIKVSDSTENSIEENVLSDNRVGIRLSTSNDNMILLNNVTNSIWDGILVDSSNGSVLMDNIVFGNGENGIVVQGCSYNTLIALNTVFNNQGWAGINLGDSIGCIVDTNVVYGHSNGNGITIGYDGMVQDSPSDHQLLDNVIYNNRFRGIRVEFSEMNLIAENTIYLNSEDGIWLWESLDNVIDQNRIHNNTWSGILVESSSNNLIDNNTVYGNIGGLGINLIGWSEYNTIIDNDIYDNVNASEAPFFGYYDGIWVDSSSSYNHIVHNQIYFQSMSPEWEYWGIALNSDENNISFNTIYNTDFAIELLEASEDNFIYMNTLYSNDIGIVVRGSNNHIFRNIVHDNHVGISVMGTYNRIDSNRVHDHEDSGIKLINANYNDIINNNVYENSINGINIHESDYNFIYNNTISNNPNEGIYLEFSNNNVIKMNHFVSGGQANDDGSNNVFLLNYWEGWTSPDANGDEIVDNPYPIGDHNQDPYPLVSPGAHAITPPILSNLIDGQVLSGTYRVEWIASVDTYDHSITYSVYYSTTGTTWVLVESGITTTSYNWDTEEFLDGSYKIKVVATCSTGHFAGHILEGTFTIKNEGLITETTPTTMSTSYISTSIPPVVIQSPGMTGIVAILSLLPLLVVKRMKRKSTKKPE